MSEDVILEGKKYVSSKKAAADTGYTRDYIGQLARGGFIEAERVGGLWYVYMESLLDYEKNADIARSLTPNMSLSKDTDSSLVFEGKDYISASRASKLTGYNQDYVGQLARGSKIPSRQIGNRWYVDKDALVAHKTEKDALLAAVQAESVGLSTSLAHKVPLVPQHVPSGIIQAAPQMNYVQEESDLIPLIPTKERDIPVASVPQYSEVKYPISNFSEIRPRLREDIELIEDKSEPKDTKINRISRVSPKKGSRRLVGISAGALTVILFITLGFASLKGKTTFSLAEKGSMSALAAGTWTTIERMGDLIENLVAPTLTYVRE